MRKAAHDRAVRAAVAELRGGHTKEAFLAWGGGQVGLHPKGRGVGVDVGYTNLLGLLPIPTSGMDIGGPNHGFMAGVAADPGSDFGLSPYIGARIGHGRSSGITRNFPRGLPELIYDKIRGQTRQEAYEKSYPGHSKKRQAQAEAKARYKAEHKRIEEEALAEKGTRSGDSDYEDENDARPRRKEPTNDE